MHPPKTKVPRKTETKGVVGGKVYKAKINQKKKLVQLPWYQKKLEDRKYH